MHFVMPKMKFEWDVFLYASVFLCASLWSWLLLKSVHSSDDCLNMFQVAAKVIGEVQALMIFPVIPYIILAVFYMFWLAATFYLFSSGDVRQNTCETNCCAYDLGSKRVSCERCCGYSIHYTPHIGVAILFHLFGGYWATHFFIACSSTVIAGSVASYYWARGDVSVSNKFVQIEVINAHFLLLWHCCVVGLQFQNIWNMIHGNFIFCSSPLKRLQFVMDQILIV